MVCRVTLWFNSLIYYCIYIFQIKALVKLKLFTNAFIMPHLDTYEMSL